MQISIVKSLDVQFLSHTSTRWHSWGAVLNGLGNLALYGVNVVAKLGVPLIARLLAKAPQL